MLLTVYCTAALTSLPDSINYITFLFSEWGITFLVIFDLKDETLDTAVLKYACAGLFRSRWPARFAVYLRIFHRLRFSCF